MIQAMSEFVANIINRSDALLDLKSMISEYEGRNILNEPFEILTAKKTAAYKLATELEKQISDSDT